MDIRGKLSAKETINVMLATSGITLKALADKLGTQPQNINNKMGRDTLRYNEMQNIAELLGYEIILTKKD